MKWEVRENVIDIEDQVEIEREIASTREREEREDKVREREDKARQAEIERDERAAARQYRKR